MFEVVDHTADVRVRVTAPTLEELFRDAVSGMYAVMRAHPGKQRVEGTIFVEDSADTTTLLVDFLNAVLRRAYTAKEMYTRIVFTHLDDTTAETIVFGVAPAEFDEDVKAVTYHEADVRCERGVWTTMLVFDI